VVFKPWQARDPAKPPDGTTPPPAADAGKLYVSASGTGPNPAATKKTLAEAVKSVRSGETIVLLDDRLEGPAAIIPSSVKNVRIEAGNATRSVVWAYKPEGTTAALGVLDIRAEGVTVEGLTVEVNGQHDTGVHVVGFCDGTTLERVTVKAARAQAFRLQDAYAKTKALRLTGCRATASPAGVVLASPKQFANRNVVLEGCRFDGVETALRVESPTDAVEFRNNRVSDVARGVQWATGVAPNEKATLTVERNTFHNVREAGIKLDGPLAPKHELTVARNFFAGTAALAVGPQRTLGVKATENAMDAASKEGPAISLKAVTVPDFAFGGTNPNEDATFLRAGGRLSAVGPSKVAVGAE
jgi:hypothetical protein